MSGPSLKCKSVGQGILLFAFHACFRSPNDQVGFFFFARANVVTCNHYMFEKYFQGLWVNFRKNQLFCFLGPKGSGKTTVNDCLTGITPVTRDDGNVQFSRSLI